MSRNKESNVRDQVRVHVRYHPPKFVPNYDHHNNICPANASRMLPEFPRCESNASNTMRKQEVILFGHSIHRALSIL
ncbi:hypothetical protein GcM3_109028, partial [Golovinomyces cichoracearum]